MSVLDDVSARISDVLLEIPNGIQTAAIKSRIEGIRTSMLEAPDQMFERGQSEIGIFLASIPSHFTWKLNAMAVWKQQEKPAETKQPPAPPKATPVAAVPPPLPPPPPTQSEVQTTPMQQEEPPKDVFINQQQMAAYAWMAGIGQVIVVDSQGNQIEAFKTKGTKDEVINNLNETLGKKYKIEWVEDPLAHAEFRAIMTRAANRPPPPPMSQPMQKEEIIMPTLPQAQSLDENILPGEHRVLSAMRALRSLRKEFKDVSTEYRKRIKAAEKKLFEIDDEENNQTNLFANNP